MKKILFFIAIVFSAVSMLAQQVTPDARLLQVWDEETIQHHVNFSPTTIQYYNYFLDHAYFIEDFPVEKMNVYADIPNLQLKSEFSNESSDFSPEGLKNLNIMKYDLSLLPDRRVTYRLGNTGKIIVFYSGYEISSEFNKVRK